jgi:uncharacterized membrane protein HdeD (DUF308 family)
MTGSWVMHLKSRKRRINMRVTESETREQLINPKWLTATAILMIILGIIAITFPLFATITSTLAFGLIFIVAGIAQIVYAFQSKGF